MQDFFGFTADDPRTVLFVANGTTDWQVWEKPRGASLVLVNAFGGGGGGTGGFTGSSTNGGASGCAGSNGNVLVPAIVLPDKLYIQCGNGGAGAVGTAGSNGQPTVVSTNPVATSTACQLMSVPAGMNSTGGQGGAAATFGLVACYGVNFSRSANLTEGNSKASNVAVNVWATAASIPNSAGAGGASNVGATAGPGMTPGAAMGGVIAAHTQALGRDGSSGQSLGNGPSQFTPWLFTGGFGGAGTVTNGGKGGTGAPACGGGGGGAGNTSGGVGGAGGPGFCIIVAISTNLERNQTMTPTEPEVTDPEAEPEIVEEETAEPETEPASE